MRYFFQDFIDSLPDSELTVLEPIIDKIIAEGLDTKRFGDLPQWQSYLSSLPTVKSDLIELKNDVRINSTKPIDKNSQKEIASALTGLIPWRKGPFDIHGIKIDTEWRSDWKWDRVIPHLDSLKNRLVLDVGCGNGYHCLRMLGEGARRIVGVDPSPRFVLQFYAIKHFLGSIPVDVLPATLDDLPSLMPVFDTVFSMGVLYHRHSPIDHLRQLKNMLRKDGQLLLETLVIEGDEHSILVPPGRYAKMNNVWFIPSATALLVWLKKCGYKNVKLVDVNQTTTEEQRSTDWMKFHSLKDFLDPNDINLTDEGHPAPRRAIFTAQA